MNIESKIISPKKETPKVEWGIHPKKDTIEIVGSLQGALKSRDTEAVRKIFHDPKTLRSLVEGGKYEQLESSFAMLVADKFGPEKNISNIDDEDVIAMIHEYDIPEQMLAEILAAEFHKKDSVAFYRMARIILENRGLLENQSVVSTAEHSLASWKGSVENDHKKALELNRKVIEEALASGDTALVAKATFGLTFNKDLKFGEKIKSYEKLARQLGELSEGKNLQYLALRFKLEEARERLKLALEAQKGGGQFKIDRMENLLEVRRLGEEILDAMKDNIEYPKLRGFALDVVKIARYRIEQEARKMKKKTRN